MDTNHRFGHVATLARYRLVAGALAGILGLTGCASTLSGTLRDAGGEPIHSVDARVNITSVSPQAAAPVSHVVAVDDDGAFSVDIEHDGQFFIEAMVPGYAITGTTLNTSEDREVELVLQRLDPARATAVGRGAHQDMSRGQGGAALMPPKL